MEQRPARGRSSLKQVVRVTLKCRCLHGNLTIAKTRWISLSSPTERTIEDRPDRLGSLKAPFHETLTPKNPFDGLTL